MYTDPSGRRRCHQLPGGLGGLGLFGGGQGDDKGLRVVLASANEEEDKGEAKVEEIEDIDDCEEMIATPPEMGDGELGAEGMALVKRGSVMEMDVPATPRLASIERFEGPGAIDCEMEDEDLGRDEEARREKKRQKRTRSKLRKKEGRKSDEGVLLSAINAEEGDKHEELQEMVTQPAIDVRVQTDAAQDGEDGVDFEVEAGRTQESAELTCRPREIPEVMTNEDESGVTLDGGDKDTASVEEDNATDDDKENIPLAITLSRPLPPPHAATTFCSKPSPDPASSALLTVPTITVTQKPLHPAAQPQYSESHPDHIPVLEAEYHVPVPEHEARGPQGSEKEEDIIVSLPPVTQPRQPLQPPLTDSTRSAPDLNFEASHEHEDIPHPHHSTQRPVPHVSPTHIDLLPLMIPSDDFDATFLAILPSTPPLEAQSVPSMSLLEPRNETPGKLIATQRGGD